jgi:hypothetical protein
MKTLAFSTAFAASLVAAVAQDAPPPPVTGAPAPAPQKQEFVYDQKPVAGRPPLVQQEQANAIVDKFKAAYPKLGSPRFVIYVNRDLVDEQSGLKITARTENTEAAGDKETVKAENRYRFNDRKEPTLADRQTVRDVERLFGRPLRMAGASLADQRVATQLLGNRDLKSLGTESEQARKDREALVKVADVAIEILISSKNIQVAELSGDRTYTIPDIQASAIQLKDAKILAQASSSDVSGATAYHARNYGVREIAEATALALMEDMVTTVDSAAK